MPKQGVIEDRYQLVSRLGEGGAGSVWLAMDLERKITVAVKVLRPELSKRKEMLQQFELEAELSARMMSPNIVKVFARGVDAHGTPYIVYELLDGEDLATRLESKPQLDLVETETVVVHVARALSRAHGVGVVHRDVKPANIYLTKDQDGRLLAKVLDFGVAELMAKTGASEELSGTLEYMAPELILEGKPPDAQTDLYSIAVVAYRCLVGEVPFTGDTLGQVMMELATKHAPPISETLGAPLPELDAWFAKGLCKDPALRFGSARELAEAFHAAAKAGKKALPALAGALVAPDSTKGEGARYNEPEVVRVNRGDALPPASYVPSYHPGRMHAGRPANMPPLPMNPPRPTIPMRRVDAPPASDQRPSPQSSEQKTPPSVRQPAPPSVRQAPPPSSEQKAPPSVRQAPPPLPPAAAAKKGPPPLPQESPQGARLAMPPAGPPRPTPRATLPGVPGPTNTAPLPPAGPPAPVAPAPLPPMRPRAQSFVFDEELDGDLLKKDVRRS